MTAGVPKKRIAARLGLDPKTVRRYVAVAEETGLRLGDDAVSETQLRDVLLALHPSGGRPPGDDWDRCRAQQEAIRGWLQDGLRLTKIRKLLGRQGVALPYPTLYRFAVVELVWPHGPDDPGRRRRARRGNPARYRVGRLAHAHRAQAALPRLDLHGRAVAPPLCLSDLRGNDADDRSV